MTQVTTPVDRVFTVARDQVSRVPIVGARGQLTATTDTTVYTAPTLTEPPNGTEPCTAVITSIVFCNSDASARTITAHLVESGGSIAANRLILSAASVAAGATWVLEFGDKGCPMASGEYLNLKAGTANTISYRVNVELLPQ